MLEVSFPFQTWLAVTVMYNLNSESTLKALPENQYVHIKDEDFLLAF